MFSPHFSEISSYHGSSSLARRQQQQFSLTLPLSANRIPIEPKKHFVFLGLVDHSGKDNLPKTLNDITCFDNVFQVFPVAEEKENLPDCAKLLGG
jgi:hypothetical protein